MAPLLPPLLAFICGIIAAPCLDSPSLWRCLPLAILISIARPKHALIPIALVGAGLRSTEPPLPPDPGGAPVRLVGTLLRPPEWRGLGVYLDVELHLIDARPYRGRARLTEFLDDPAVRALFDELDLGTGDRLEILVKLQRPVVYRNPGVFDYRRHLQRQGIYWTGNIRNPRLITVLEKGWHGIDRIKFALESRLAAPFKNDPAVRGLVMGMVLGRKHGLTGDAERKFQAGGLYHLVVVSGFNLAVVAGTAIWLARFVFRKRSWRLLFVLAASLAYSSIVEGQVPVLRATLMVGFLVIGRLLDRGHAVMNAIAGTALLILLWDPVALEDPSFQMTFAAVLAIVGLGVPAGDWMLGALRESLKNFGDASRDARLSIDVADWRIARRAWCELRGLPTWVLTAPWRVALLLGEAAVISIAVEIIFVYFMVESFHRISPVSPLLNIPAGLITAAVTPLGLAILTLPPSLAAIPAAVIHRLLRALLDILDLGLALPAATLRVPSTPLWLWLIYAAVITILILAIRKRRRRVFVCSLGAVAALQTTMAAADFSPRPPADATITFLDVGQGDSTLIELPSGERMLIDAGGSAAGRFLSLRDESTFSIGESVVSGYLFSRGIRRLDTVVLTHAHHDHMDGLFDVVDNFQVGEIWLGRNPMIPRYRELVEKVHARRIPIRWVKEGDRIGDFTVLHPPGTWKVRSAARNDDSVVLLLETGNSSALFTGDLERPLPFRGGPAGSSFLSRLPAGRLTVLKVPHHGSKGVRLKMPAQIRVVSVGSNNPFGHPHASALPALRTDRDGAITITLRGKGQQAAPFQVFTDLTQRCPSCKLSLLSEGH